MIEKLNNKDYIYRNIQLFYECSSEKTFKDVLDDFIRNILSDILFNISENDLKDLLKCKENYKYLRENVYTNSRIIRLKLLDKIAKKTNKNFSNIIHQNTQKFLDSNYMCDVLEEIIY